MKMRGLLLGGLLAAVLVVLTVGPRSEAQDKGYDTPQAVFEAASKAAKKGDWKTFAACLTPDSRDMMVGQVAMLGLIVKGFAALDPSGKAAEKLKPLDELYEKHGLTKDKLKKLQEETPKGANKDPKAMAKALRRVASEIKDKPAFLTETMKFFDKLNEGKKKGKAPLEGAELKDVKIDGNKATGKVTTSTADKDRTETITFVKSSAGWKMEMPLPRPMGGATKKPKK